MFAAVRGWTATLASLLVSDVVALSAAAIAIVAARQGFGGSFLLSEYLRLWPVIGVFLLSFALTGLYPGVAIHPAEELRRVFYSIVADYLLLGVAAFLLRSADWSRSIYLLSGPACILFVMLGRTAVRRCFSGSAWWGIPAVIVGSGDAGRQALHTLEKNPALGLRVVATLEPRAHAMLPMDEPLSRIEQLRDGRQMPYVIVAMSGANGGELTETLEDCAHRFEHVLLLPELGRIASLGVTATDLGGHLGLRIRHNLLRRMPQLAKRVMDLSAVLALSTVCVPFVALIALAVRITSKGPVFYGQKRIGRSGATFRVWKFRTMVRNADRVLKAYLGEHPEAREEWDNFHKLRMDPRITALGNLLRRTSIDELPQLWNVLRGEMTLVGPRPIVDAEVPKYGDNFRMYCKVRPGITGLWQVSGRNDTSYEDRVKMDEYYVRNWSVWLDLYVLGRTFRAVLSSRGAY